MDMWFLIILSIFFTIGFLCWLDGYIKFTLWTKWRCLLLSHKWNYKRGDSFCDAYCDRCNLGMELH